jgi:hypothetical protein
MVIISYAPIRDFAVANPAVGDALKEWFFKCKASDWK